MKTKTMTTLHLRKSIGRSPCRGALLLIPLAIAATFVEAAVAAPSPGVVAGGFCTYGTGYFKTSTEAAQRINQYFGGTVTSPAAFFQIGTASNTYTWRRTNTIVPVSQGNRTVSVDS